MTRLDQIPSTSDVQLSTASGIYLPSSFGQFWKPKRNAAGSGLARIGLIGDSIGRGYFSSNLNTKGWAALLASALQAQYGDGGSGWQGVVDSVAGMTAVGVAAGARTNYAAQQVGTTGTWTSGGDPNGPGSILIYTTAAGSTATFTVRGTIIDLFYQVASNGANPVAWTIDGVAQTPINMVNATTLPAAVTVSGLSAGTHTVVITAPAGTNVTTLYGCVGRNASGVVLHNFSRFGTGSSNFATSGLNWSGGPNWPTGPVDLLIYAIAANDASGGTGVDAWLANAGNAVRRVREVATPQTDILFMLPHIGNFDNSSPQYPGIVSRARGLAEASGAALLDLWTIGRNSWAYWNSLGYWSDASGSGATGTDPVHPSDTGHAFMETQVFPILTAA